MPSRPRPIVTIGAGSIVADAHFPAYRKAAFPIAGVYDLDAARAESVAERFGVAKVFRSLAEAVATEGAIFDLATPPGAHESVLQHIPVGSGVLIQKPVGADLDQATEILKVCRDRKLVAAANFQLRFAPMMLAVRDALDRGILERLVDVEVHLAIDTPWGLFAFLKGLPRVEIAVHSIHYLDLIRSFLGDPSGVHAKTIGHPSSDMAQTRTTAILDYGDDVRSAMSLTHNHAFGRKHQVAEFRFDGTQGAAYAKLGLLLDYPRGEADELWIRAKGETEWVQVPLQGSWFPDAFIGRMANLQRFCAGEDPVLIASIEDAWTTMALVEAAFESSAKPATPLRPHP
jgi:predicted dehydrogenase